MRKTFIWALMAALVVTGSAIAAPGRVQANATYPLGSPATTNNDDSCDIGTAPAATLLLPYFEVDTEADSGVGETTLFTITNTSNESAIAHVTLWTDYSFPVIDFNIYLTGYDVQSINLYDVIHRGQIAPTEGTGPLASNEGELSVDGPYDYDACDNTPVQLGTQYITRMESAFIDGVVPALGGTAGCNNVGNAHEHAIGYATVDLATACTTTLPTEDDYAETTLAFDNWLIGDYQQINGGENFAQGNPMVHIRAIPEGGGPTNLPDTFYTRYNGTGDDDRQPLPALFAARWISGGATGFETYYKIWREGVTGADPTSCAEWSDNGELAITEITRFDEEENPNTIAPGEVVSPPITPGVSVLPETSATNVDDDSIYPTQDNGAVAGWMYLNLDNTSGDFPDASQNWVVVSMRAEGRYSVDFDAAWLGNGCTAEVAASEAASNSGDPIGPPPDDYTKELLP